MGGGMWEELWGPVLRAHECVAAGPG